MIVRVTEQREAGAATVTRGDGDPRGSPSPGRAAIPKLDRYVMRAVLGAGAMGQVWRAHDPVLTRDVAVKVIAGTASSAMLERLAREARAMAKLSDPHVVGVFDVGTHQLDEQRRGMFIVMELVEGTTLAQWLTTPRTFAAIVDAFVQAGLGLTAAHDAGLVHRDFKPANVLVGDDGRVRVGDFGIARRGNEIEAAPRELVEDSLAHELADTLAGSLTESGFVMGTPLYMAPEQHRGEIADARSDQYAFCVALYEALAGVRPFHGDASSIHAAKVSRQLQPPAREIPERLLAIVRRGLSPTPSERWPSMRALVAALRTRTKGRRGLALASVAAATIVGVVALAPSADATTCDELRRIDEAWGDTQRRTLHELLDESSGADAASRAITAIDAHAEALRGELVAGCGASATGACLRDATTQLVTTLDSLATDGRAARDAIATVRGLPDPRACADERGPAPPELAAIRDQGATAHALSNAGQLDRAIAMAEDAREQSVALGPVGAPIAAQLAYRIGTMRDDLGLDALAATSFEEAHYGAMNVDDDRLAASAAIRLSLLFTESGNHTDAEVWRRHARATSARASFDACESIEYEMYEAAIDSLHYELDDGLRRLTALVDRCRRDECERLCLIAMSNRAEVLEQLGRPEEAVAVRREVVAGQRDVYGADSNQVALAELGLAESLLEANESTEALATIERTIPRLDALLGRAHPSLAHAYVLLAQVKGRLGDTVGAVAAAKEALALGEQFFDGDARRREAIRGTLANTLGDAGDLEGALRLYDLILDDPTAAKSSQLVARIGRGFTRMQAGDIDGAVADAVLARAGLPAGSVEMIELTYANEAEAYVAAKRCQEADRVLVDAIAWAVRAGRDNARERLTISRAALTGRCLSK